MYKEKSNEEIKNEPHVLYCLKLMVTISLCETVGVVLNFVLYLTKAEIVLDDLMDSLMKVCK